MPEPQHRTSIKVQAERAVLAAVRLPGDRYDENDPLGELGLLAEQAGAVIVGELVQHRKKPESGTFIGRGKLEELTGLCDAVDATLVIFDHNLSPKQIGNIEQATGRKIIDRSELILDIFASRATSHEAKLQVELAQLQYTYPRLRAMWDHLERIVGTGGIVGLGARGPGEQQIEIDRRLVQKRRNDLSRQLKQIQTRKHRQVQKRNLDHFTVGLVGYTNAGKSTLFNTFTAGGAYADDRLFATLISRTRLWNLGGGMDVMLSDTVGFVRDLPHNLIASFKATLEEATHADLLLIVLDVSDPAAELHYQTVERTLEELFEEVSKAEGSGEGVRKGEGGWSPPEQIVLLNKADLLRDNTELLIWQQRVPGSIPLCSLASSHGMTPMGQEELQRVVREAATGAIRELLITAPLSDSKTIHTLENHGEVLDRQYAGSSVTMRTRIGARQLAQIQAGGGGGARLRIEPAPQPHSPPHSPTPPTPPPTLPPISSLDKSAEPADTSSPDPGP